MMIKTSSGVMLHGEITKEPEIRNAGQRQVLSLNLKVHSVKNAAGKWEGLFVEVDLWGNLDAWDGMFQKGDYITAFARELKERQYNGKTYYSVDAVDIQPGGLAIFRWMQNVIDLATQPLSPAEPHEMAETDEATPFDPPPEPEPVQTSLTGGQLYPGESLSDYKPDRDPAPTADDAPIDEDADDLPF